MILVGFGYNSGIMIFIEPTNCALPKWAKLKQGENKMKIGIMTGILIVALVALSTGVAAAQYGQGGGDGARYVDTDGNGICDNIGTRPGFVDADGDGVCDNNFGRGCGCGGMNFVDEDGNGVCDYFGINGRDYDGDGIPNGKDDDYNKRSQDGNGNGNGKQGKWRNQ